MRTLLLRWAVIVIAVFGVRWAMQEFQPSNTPIIEYSDWLSLAIFAAVLAVLNTFVRPILLFLSIPFTCLTAGLFVFVINTGLFALAGALVPGFHVADFWAALIGAMAVSVVGVAVNFIARERK